MGYGECEPRIEGIVQCTKRYSLTCIKRPLKGKMKNGLLIEVVSKLRFGFSKSSVIQSFLDGCILHFDFMHSIHKFIQLYYVSNQISLFQTLFFFNPKQTLKT